MSSLHPAINGYVFFYAQKRVELYASTLWEAKQKAIAYFNPPKSKQHLVHGMLAEKNGVQVTHTPTE